MSKPICGGNCKYFKVFRRKIGFDPERLEFTRYYCKRYRAWIPKSLFHKPCDKFVPKKKE